MRISELTAPTRELVVSLPEGRLKLAYRAKGYTARYEQALLSLDRAAFPALQLAEALGSILVDWDLTDDDGSPIAPSQDLLSGLPTDTIVEMLRAIREDMRPNPTSGEPSAAG